MKKKSGKEKPRYRVNKTYEAQFKANYSKGLGMALNSILKIVKSVKNKSDNQNK